eukprot:5697335-Amphidinium_carterae.1
MEDNERSMLYFSQNWLFEVSDRLCGGKQFHERVPCSSTLTGEAPRPCKDDGIPQQCCILWKSVACWWHAYHHHLWCGERGRWFDLHWAHTLCDHELAVAIAKASCIAEDQRVK